MNNIVPIGKIRYYKRHSNYEFRYIDESVENICISNDYKSKSEALPHHTVFDLFITEVDKENSNLGGIIFMRDKQKKDRTYFLPINPDVVSSVLSKDVEIPFIGDSKLFKLEFIFEDRINDKEKIKES